MAGIASNGSQDCIAKSSARVVGLDIEVVVSGDVGAGGLDVEFTGSCQGGGSKGGRS